MTTVLTLGTFDLFHEGHVAFLRRCRALAGPDGDVIVGLNTDRFAASYKRPPVIGYHGREAVLRACRYVDDVVPNDQPNGAALDVIALVRPTVVAASWGWHPSTGKDWYVQVGIPPAWFAERGIAIEWIPYTAGVSTSAIAAAL